MFFWSSDQHIPASKTGSSPTELKKSCQHAENIFLNVSSESTPRKRPGKKLCLPVPVGVAQPWSSTGYSSVNCEDLERGKERGREMCETLRGTNILSPLAFLAHRFSSFLAHLLEHSDAYLCLSLTQTQWLPFPRGLSVSSICVIPASRKIGAPVCRLRLLFVESNAQSHPVRFIVLSYSRMPASSAGTAPST